MLNLLRFYLALFGKYYHLISSNQAYIRASCFSLFLMRKKSFKKRAQSLFNLERTPFTHISCLHDAGISKQNYERTNGQLTI